MGYGASQVRDLTRGAFQSDRALTPSLAVTMVNGAHQGTMSCEVAKTKVDWLRQASGMLFNVALSFLPF